MNKRRIIHSAIIVVALAIAGSWLAYYYSPSRQAKEEFNIAFNEWVGFAPFFLAKEKGFYGDLPVAFHFIALEDDKRAGLYAGRFQMVAETLDMFQSNRDQADYQGKIVFAVDESAGGDGVVATAEVQSLKDLKGMAAVSEPGQPAHFILRYLLAKEGMTLKDLRHQDASSSDAAAAFIAHRVDVAATYEPYLTEALKKREGAHLLVSSKDLPGFIVDAAIASDSVLTKRRADIEAVYMGWCKALDYYDMYRSDAVAIMAKAYKLSLKDFEATTSGLRYIGCQENKEMLGTAIAPGPLFKTFATIGEVLKANGLTKATAQPSQKIDSSIVHTAVVPQV